MPMNGWLGKEDAVCSMMGYYLAMLCHGGTLGALCWVKRDKILYHSLQSPAPQIPNSSPAHRHPFLSCSLKSNKSLTSVSSHQRLFPLSECSSLSLPTSHSYSSSGLTLYVSFPRETFFPDSTFLVSFSETLPQGTPWCSLCSTDHNWN